MATLYRTIDGPSSYEVNTLLKSKLPKSINVCLNSEPGWIPVEIELDKNKRPSYIDKSTGWEIDSWKIGRVQFVFEAESAPALGVCKVFDEPVKMKDLDLPRGDYICKYVCPTDMREELDILRMSKVPNIGGMFLFDIKEYLVLSVQLINYNSGE